MDAATTRSFDYKRHFTTTNETLYSSVFPDVSPIPNWSLGPTRNYQSIVTSMPARGCTNVAISSGWVTRSTTAHLFIVPFGRAALNLQSASAGPPGRLVMCARNSTPTTYATGHTGRLWRRGRIRSRGRRGRRSGWWSSRCLGRNRWWLRCLRGGHRGRWSRRGWR